MKIHIHDWFQTLEKFLIKIWDVPGTSMFVMEHEQSPNWDVPEFFKRILRALEPTMNMNLHACTALNINFQSFYHSKF